MVFAACKKCKAETKHRTIKDNRPGRKRYLACTICLQNNSKKHRKRYWCRYLAQKANARKIPGSVKITEQLLESIAYDQRLRCVLTGIRFDIESKWYRPSLDRIDSNKGYTPDNIRLVVWIVNHSRGDLTDKEFITMCKQVAEKNNK